MKTLQEALDIIRLNTQTLGIEQVSVFNSMNYVLAEDIISTLNIPPFDKSAMDGYACKYADLDDKLEVIDFVSAGTVSEKEIQSGQCIKIMTGATIPNGGEIVVMKEFVEEQSDGTITYVGKSQKSNICYKGEDLKVGDLVVQKGTLMRSEHIAVLTGLGISTLSVYKKPKVGIISTGSELVEVGEELEPGKIYNSNGFQLENRVNELGFEVINYGIVKDDYNQLINSVKELCEECSIVFISGGVSVGDLDLVPEVIQNLDYQIYLTELSTKPGKHTLFARKNNKYILGLPGNPVSAYVQMEIVGRYLLNVLMGCEWKSLRISGRLKTNITRKKSDRLELVPVRFDEDGLVEKIEYHGSAHINALTHADALLEFPLGETELKVENRVYVRPIR